MEGRGGLGIERKGNVATWGNAATLSNAVTSSTTTETHGNSIALQPNPFTSHAVTPRKRPSTQSPPL